MNQSLKRMNSVIEGNRTLLSDFYRVYYKNLTKIHDKCDIKSIKKYINYSDIMDVICSDNYKKYKRRRTLARICSLRRQKEHSVLCLAGVKMKFNTSK